MATSTGLLLVKMTTSIYFMRNTEVLNAKSMKPYHCTVERCGSKNYF